VIRVDEFTVKLEVPKPLNSTLDTLRKFVPVMKTFDPIVPLLGDTLVTDGAGAATTVKLPLLVAAPLGVTTLISPVVALLGTVTVICVGEFTVNAKELAAWPLNVTAIAPVKLVPSRITVDPIVPLDGSTLARVGAAAADTVKLIEVATPLGVATVMGPVVAFVGTVAVIWVGERTVKTAAIPLNSTETVPWKFAPRMVIGLPGEAKGSKAVIVGAASGFTV
jgi:hypothetical protein